MVLSIFIDHLVVFITVMISAWYDLLSLILKKETYVFIDNRWLFKPLSYETSCGMFTFVISHTICSIFFSVNWGKPDFSIFDGRT